MLRIWGLPSTEDSAIAFFQERGLLHAKRTCTNGHPMKLYLGQRQEWKCNTKGCRQRINLRNCNWFCNTKLPFTKMLRFIYSWSEELTSIKWCEKQIGINKSTATDWNNYMREVCVAVMTSKANKLIGGENQIVEIDESLFSKRKNNTGRVLPQVWIFGGICRITNECFLTQVPDRNAKTLLNAIVQNIATGSIIFSDSWSGYKTPELEEAGFEHFKVNHRFNFVNPMDGTHTQTVERMWGSAKWRNKKHRGTARHHLESYFAEFMWRRMIGDGDVFEELIRAWAKYWPLE